MIPKYEYHLCTWGGFYNEEYKSIHKLEPGYYWFDTEEERDTFIKERRELEEKLKAHHLMISTSQGYCCRIRTTLHRVIRFEDKEYYSTYDLGINYPFNVAKYHLKWKWQPGFNDYPLGEDFNYSKVKIVSQWITGADQEIED